MNNISQCLEPKGTIQRENAGKIELDLAKKNMVAEVAGLLFLTVAVWDCALALPSSECKPRPPACYWGTTRLQLRSTLKRIFKCLLINWALWCALSVCSLHVFWCPCQMILPSAQSADLAVHAWYLCIEISTSSCPSFPIKHDCYIYILSPNWIDLKVQSTHAEGSR